MYLSEFLTSGRRTRKYQAAWPVRARKKICRRYGIRFGPWVIPPLKIAAAVTLSRDDAALIVRMRINNEKNFWFNL